VDDEERVTTDDDEDDDDCETDCPKLVLKPEPTGWVIGEGV